jgi:hypothetical protein
MVSRVQKFWEYDFPHLWRAITATQFSLKPHSMLTLQETWANYLGTSTWRVNSPKITNLWTSPRHCLQLRTTWNLGQYLRQDYVQILTSSASICYLTVSVKSRLSCHPQNPKLDVVASTLNVVWWVCHTICITNQRNKQTPNGTAIIGLKTLPWHDINITHKYKQSTVAFCNTVYII